MFTCKWAQMCWSYAPLCDGCSWLHPVSRRCRGSLCCSSTFQESHWRAWQWSCFLEIVCLLQQLCHCGRLLPGQVLPTWLEIEPENHSKLYISPPSHTYPPTHTQTHFPFISLTVAAGAWSSVVYWGFYAPPFSASRSKYQFTCNNMH